MENYFTVGFRIFLPGCTSRYQEISVQYFFFAAISGICRSLSVIFVFSITKTQRIIWETLLRSKIKQAHMEIFKKYKWLFFAIVGNLLLIYADLLTFGKFRISLLTIVFGYTPLFILIVKTVRQNKLHN